VYTFDENTYSAGTHTFTWDAKSNSGSDVTAGYYLVKLTAGDFTTVKKLIVMD
jgi:flagellar hook assembly protein FlgD